MVEAIGAEAQSRFTGRIPKVTIEVRDADAKADAAVERGPERSGQAHGVRVVAGVVASLREENR